MTARECIAYIALGANLGHPRGMFEDVVRALDAIPGVEVIARSRWHRTAPVGTLDQPDFLNGVVAVRTVLSPEQLWECLCALERRGGRRRSAKNRSGPRTLDLDLLMFGDQTIATDDLTVPHPRMHERAFVLVPLAEIAPFVRHPVLRRSIRELRDAVLATPRKDEPNSVPMSL
ncbi:MAG: 2-amino-4-hydroxy-6-hydroxymethyldihydropteridine diphosphokinase [Phycisphaerales bacterium]|nr:2-amino-4-hydroxy-6-hydroxymethyldihydropteridine diphosphokinase [Phycisphaerales bacterium]